MGSVITVGDLVIRDIQWAWEKAAAEIPTLTVVQWIPGSMLRWEHTGVAPDMICVMFDDCRWSQGLPPYTRFLLWLDLVTHSTPSFGEMVKDGVAYLRSESYRKRFGTNAGGLWLVVTTGSVWRMHGLMRQTRQAVGEGAGVFWFTTLDDIKGVNPLFDSIWCQAGEPGPKALFAT